VHSGRLGYVTVENARSGVNMQGTGVISNCRFRNNLISGIDVHGPDVQVLNNEVDGGGHHGIGVGFGSSNVLVGNNYVAHAHGGIVVEAGPATIRNNRLVDNLLGIALPFYEGVEVTGNIIEWQGGMPDGWYYQGTRIYDQDMPPSGIIGAFPGGYPLIHDNVEP
jgi:hypothetical protein